LTTLYGLQNLHPRFKSGRRLQSQSVYSGDIGKNLDSTHRRNDLRKFSRRLGSIWVQVAKQTLLDFLYGFAMRGIYNVRVDVESRRYAGVTESVTSIFIFWTS